LTIHLDHSQCFNALIESEDADMEQPSPEELPPLDESEEEVKLDESVRGMMIILSCRLCHERNIIVN
jgi:hypothetical protein